MDVLVFLLFESMPVLWISVILKKIGVDPLSAVGYSNPMSMYLRGVSILLKK